MHVIVYMCFAPNDSCKSIRMCESNSEGKGKCRFIGDLLQRQCHGHLFNFIMPRGAHSNSKYLYVKGWTMSSLNLIMALNEMFSFKKMHFKMSSAKWRQFRLNVSIVKVPMPYVYETRSCHRWACRYPGPNRAGPSADPVLPTKEIPFLPLIPFWKLAFVGRIRVTSLVCNGVWFHQPLDCLFKRFSRIIAKRQWKLSTIIALFPA